MTHQIKVIRELMRKGGKTPRRRYIRTDQLSASLMTDISRLWKVSLELMTDIYLADDISTEVRFL
jgi:hypothetical protein